ncbi:MAG: hypothetical protein C5B52_18840 [Bacteroidetes bacterium]|nr:MAG: hypothetical protein C5B52_18840 [Bacteroidota bacterium]
MQNRRNEISTGTDLTMKKQILFIHSGGSQGPHEGSNDLVGYLKSELGHEYDLRYPQMPDPENPHYEDWKQLINREMESLGSSLILIGHSLGGSVLIKYLSEEGCSKNIEGLFLVAAPFFGIKDWKVHEFVLNKNFVAALPSIGKIYLYHSLNDEVVPFNHLNFYAEKFPGAIVRSFKSNLHLFSRGIPILISDIKNL